MELLQNFGFPIVCVVVMAYFVYYLMEKFFSQISAIEDLHKQEVDKLASVIENNTLAITRLVERMGE